ncbi:MAG: helix-turn-helix domain-containing protein [Pseudonocardiaceae bacterium]|nr:helix-turn-helix domain-containing protein [Pseudonocardiaceae bacterium]
MEATDESCTIGQRARTIRRRRGLSVEVAAGLAGISKGYLSLLERGHRRFERRGLLEDLAGALGCAVADLTGQPYLPTDRDTADALAELPELVVALYDTTPDDALDIPVRLVDQLVRAAAQANRHCEEARYALACRDLGVVLAELHTHAATGNTDTRRAALRGLVEGCVAAFGTTRKLGRTELAVQAARRAQEAARLLGDPAVTGFATLIGASGFSSLGARRAAADVLSGALVAIEPEADPASDDTGAAEAFGVMHLLSAQLAARKGRPDEADARISEAAGLAVHTGERNTLQWHFGPANVAAWSLAIGVETQRGPSRRPRRGRPRRTARATRPEGSRAVSALHSETLGRFRWLKNVECDDDAGVTIHTARAQLPTGLLVERVRDRTDLAVVFVTDLPGCEITLSTAQSAEWGAALVELPAP